MSEVNFAVSTDLKALQAVEIEANFAACKKGLEEMIAPYVALVVTEDGIKEAKKDLASIRKTRDSIEDSRKLVKKLYSEPLTRFEGKVKELTAICEKGISNLDKQIKDFAEKKAEEKVADLLAWYDSVVGDMKEYLPWGKLYNPRWRNTTYSQDTAKQEIVEAVEKCARDVEGILALHHPQEPAMLAYYKECGDLGSVMHRMEQLKKLEEDAQKRREAAAQKQAAQKASWGVKTGPLPPKEPEAAPAEEREAESQQLYVVDFRAYLTKEQVSDLQRFFQERGIRYGRVPKQA